MEHLSKIGSVVYIKISYETLAERLGDYRHRGVVMPEGYTLRDLYNERSALYEKYAHYTLETDSLSMSETLDSLASVCREALS